MILYKKKYFSILYASFVSSWVVVLSSQISNMRASEFKLVQNEMTHYKQHKVLAGWSCQINLVTSPMSAITVMSNA